jgi:CRISPR-associated protein Cas1
LAFSLTRELAGRYNKHLISARFQERALEMDLLAIAVADITTLMGGKHGRRNRK